MIASKRLQNLRLKECNACEFKRDSFSLFGIVIFKRKPQCKKCKCLIEYKIKLKPSKCPEQKW